MLDLSHDGKHVHSQRLPGPSRVSRLCVCVSFPRNPQMLARCWLHRNGVDRLRDTSLSTSDHDCRNEQLYNFYRSASIVSNGCKQVAWGSTSIVLRRKCEYFCETILSLTSFFCVTLICHSPNAPKLQTPTECGSYNAFSQAAQTAAVNQNSI